MKIVALLTVRNEELYLDRCLRHMVEHGIDICVVDNASSDRTRSIAESYLGRGVIEVVDLPYSGCFELRKILEHEQQLAARIEADWFMHCDADEIREPPASFRTLKEAFIEVDRQGFNAVDFDEFVFVPTSETESFEGSDYVSAMRYYYYFAPEPLRRVNAWKCTGAAVDLASAGGHVVRFENQRVFPKNFVMRHYMSLSRAHLVRKYTRDRTYSPMEVARLGWHGWRASATPDSLRLPDRSRLKFLDPACPAFDRSDPQATHLVFWPAS